MVPGAGDVAGPVEGICGFLPPQQTIKSAVIFGVVLVACIAALLATFMFVVNPHGAIVFHVRATDVSGLDPARSPVIHPSFGLALRVDNRGMFRDCWENVTVTVFHGDTVVGWGTVPDFCAEKRGSSPEVKAVMSHAPVVLTDAQRYALALQLGTGELELEVEMRMLLSTGYMGRSCADCASRQGFQLCTVNPGRQAYSRCQFFHLLDGDW